MPGLKTLIGIKANNCAGPQIARSMANIIFKCPRTGMNVQHWLADEPADDSHSSYETAVCPACSSFHFINRSSGKLLGADNAENQD